jgi:hypothetical protein
MEMHFLIARTPQADTLEIPRLQWVELAQPNRDDQQNQQQRKNDK